MTIRRVREPEHEALGQLMVSVYAGLEGFPTPRQQPDYYRMLARIAEFADRPGTEVLIASTDSGELAGGVVYFGDMAEYGSGGSATTQTHASGIRLLGVDSRYRGSGVGRQLTNACIDRAAANGHSEVILHTTAAMKIAWRMYEKLGFRRSPDLDFDQHGLAVFGFRLALSSASAGPTMMHRSEKSTPD